MLQYLLLYLFMLIVRSNTNYVNRSMTKPGRVRFYPKKSIFRKSDFIDHGCVVFIKDCPAAYKRDLVCARHYEGSYRTFNNYCELEYENCNGWRRNYLFGIHKRYFYSTGRRCCGDGGNQFIELVKQLTWVLDTSRRYFTKVRALRRISSCILKKNGAW